MIDPNEMLCPSVVLLVDARHGAVQALPDSSSAGIFGKAFNCKWFLGLALL
ncbi:hypothetical protein KQH60_12360 [Mycetohabitans sp. B8]|uniref:hypothetical protein n=1 Tax=Mycetohabitans sp. B8 TaxID=2841845 RepID=UPI001F3E5D66|nr:hypothetical protein [Mycetohabitans sp. B8]MCG1043289.1 hypothetical protein [Mycetohabitans sp. B8]